MSTKILLSLAAAAALILPLGCGGSSAASITLEPQASDSADMKAAKEKFNLLCWTCHGKTGHGDGPAAPPEPKPRSFGDKDWQASVTDQHLYNVILGGGAAVQKSPLMPPNPDLADKPGVVKALVQIVRSFGTK
jgi:mono/diheme cytochrome c family protein